MKPQPKERPILFNTEMVQAIMDGRKTQTRRIIKNLEKGSIYCPELSNIGYSFVEPSEYAKCKNPDEVMASVFTSCPYGRIDDKIWVRETFHKHYSGIYSFRADNRIKSIL